MPWINQYKQMVNTRTLYKFEGEFFNKKEYKYLLRRLTLKKLNAIAKHVWSKERISYAMPTIRFGKGIHHCGQPVSWCDGTTIELVHAAGHYLHNAKFVNTYVKYLTKYTSIPKKELVRTMKEYNVDLPKKYRK